MSAALGLLRLQKVDSRIDQLEAQLAEIRAELENDQAVAARRSDVSAAEAALLQVEDARGEAERLAKSQRIKLEQAEASLYGGRVQNPKELEDLQADVLSLKRHLATLEEAELQRMIELESAETGYQNARTALEHALVASGGEHSRLALRESELARQLADTQAERAAAISPIAERAVEEYQGLRRSRRGVAVIEINENACGACGTILTPALQQSARHAMEIVHCPSCGRILYGG
ncbi:MAG TPA: C4-type zinc ribbon domain-containing protein [Anaerolineales bacterium]